MEQKEFEEILCNKVKYVVSENLYECPVCHKQFSIKGFGVHLKKQHINADNGIKIVVDIMVIIKKKNMLIKFLMQR